MGLLCISIFIVAGYCLMQNECHESDESVTPNNLNKYDVLMSIDFSEPCVALHWVEIMSFIMTLGIGLDWLMGAAPVFGTEEGELK